MWETPQHLMAPQLTPFHGEQIHATILRELPNEIAAATVECSTRAVRRIRPRLRRFGTTTNLPNRVGRELKITPPHEIYSPVRPGGTIYRPVPSPAPATFRAQLRPSLRAAWRRCSNEPLCLAVRIATGI